MLDEPSIGLHPSNLQGLTGVMEDLIADGNSVVLVDHDTQVLSGADWLVELGPGAGAGGGVILAQGTVEELTQNPASLIGPYLTGGAGRLRAGTKKEELFALGDVAMATRQLHTVKPLEVCFPKGRLSVVTGVSGSGKTTMVLELSLIHI